MTRFLLYDRYEGCWTGSFYIWKRRGLAIGREGGGGRKRGRKEKLDVKIHLKRKHVKPVRVKVGSSAAATFSRP